LLGAIGLSEADVVIAGGNGLGGIEKPDPIFP